MIESFLIQNFRCFADLTIGPLGRVNLVAGKNNAGKTALLEALFLFTGRTVHLDRWVALSFQTPRRRLTDFHSDVLLYDDIQWDFRREGKSFADAICFQGKDSSGRSARLEATLRPGVNGPQGWQETPGWRSGPSGTGPASTSGPLGWQASPGGQGATGGPLGYGDDRKDLQVEFSQDDPPQGEPRGARARLILSAPGQHVDGAGQGKPPLCLFLPSTARLVARDITRFSELKAERNEGWLVEALRTLEPRLTGLQVLSYPDLPTLHGDVGLGRDIPISLMGEGVQRVFAFAMAANAASGGALLIDEVENGLHYSVLGKVWTILGDLARKFDVQIFATTHSYECIQAAQAAFAGEHANDLRLHRLEMVRGELNAITFDPEDLATAVDMEHEVR